MSSKLENVQQEKREETFDKIHNAILYLRKEGLAINKATVAFEAELSRTTLYKSHVIAFLKQYPEFNSNLVEFTDMEAHRLARKEIESYIAILDKKEKAMESLMKKCIRLEEDNNRLQRTLDNVTDKYERLLWDYQTRGPNNTIKL